MKLLNSFAMLCFAVAYKEFDYFGSLRFVLKKKYCRDTRIIINERDEVSFTVEYSMWEWPTDVTMNEMERFGRLVFPRFWHGVLTFGY